MSNVTKCYRCRKRSQDFERWYADYIMGLELGAICPTCQAADEDMETQINEAMGSTVTIETGVLGPFEAMMSAVKHGEYQGDERGAVGQLARILANTYRTPEAMRSGAERLPSLAKAVVSLMRRTADEMEVSNRRWDYR